MTLKRDALVAERDAMVLKSTNHHVLNDKAKGRLHDVFLIGRFKRADQDPELVCAGQPSAAESRQSDR